MAQMTLEERAAQLAAPFGSAALSLNNFNATGFGAVSLTSLSIHSPIELVQQRNALQKQVCTPACKLCERVCCVLCVVWGGGWWWDAGCHGGIPH